MTRSIETYIANRAELLANLVLTRRKDVSVLKFSVTDDAGLDLVARVPVRVHDEEIHASFGVVVMGTNEPLPNEHIATKHANARSKHGPSKGFFLFPIVLFLFSMEEDQGYYSWLIQPHVTRDEGPTLIRISPLDMTKMSKKSVDHMIDQVRLWFEAMGEIVLKAVPSA